MLRVSLRGVLTVPAVSEALIAGAGIAGLSAGLTLARVGVRATVVEPDPGVVDEGTGLTISAVGMRAIRDLGLADEVTALGAGYSDTIIGDAAGRELHRIAYPPMAGSELPAAGGIMRSDFHRLLIRAAEREGVSVRLGVGVSDLELRADGVRISLSDGGTGQTELLVGADGLHSRVRGLAFPHAPQPTYTGQRVWRVLIKRSSEFRGRDHGMWYGPICKAGITPLSEADAYMFIVENSPEPVRPPPDEWLDRLREQLADFDGVIGWVRDTQLEDLSRVDCRPLYAILVPLPWHRGRAVLVGDALHATTPHMASGAAMGMEDAIVLADLMAQERDAAVALERFGRLRFDRCRTVVEGSLQLGEWEKHPDAPGADPAGLMGSSMAALARPYRAAAAEPLP